MEEKTRKAPFLYWLWMPILHNIVLYVSVSLIGIVIGKLFGRGDWGAVVIGAWALGIFAVVMIPLMTITYCKNVRYLGWKKYLCCFYDAVLIAYFELNGRITLKVILYYMMAPQAIIAFTFALLCGLFTLIYYNRKDKNIPPKEVPIGSGYLN